MGRARQQRRLGLREQCLLLHFRVGMQDLRVIFASNVLGYLEASLVSAPLQRYGEPCRFSQGCWRCLVLLVRLLIKGSPAS